MRTQHVVGPVAMVAAAAVIGGGGYLFLRSGHTESPPNRAQAAEFCEEHQVPEAICPFCNPALIESLGFCAGHGVPEAFCTRCNPEVIPAFKAVNDWCAEHGLPESQCAVCRARPTGDADAQATQGGTDGGIKLVRSDDIPRSRRPPAVTCATNNTRVRFRSPEIAANAGLVFVDVARRAITETIPCNAEIAYDGNHYVRIASRVPGVIHSVRVDLGMRVKEGDFLAEVDSAELAAAKADYLQSEAALGLWEKNHARERGLLQRGVSTEKDALEAETRWVEAGIGVARARQKLRNLGLREGDVANVAENNDTSPLLPITAPLAGVVVERVAVVGESVRQGATLFAVANTSAVWAILDLYEGDLEHVRRGQPVVLSVDGLRGETFGGRVTWISNEVDRRTRTIKVRALMDNAGGHLRAHMFGRAGIRVHEGELLPVVPKSAVQWEGCCNIVFIRRSDTLFEPRKVRLGAQTDEFYEVLDGLAVGDTIVTQGSFLLKTEILKGSIGAGCCEVEHLDE